MIIGFKLSDYPVLLEIMKKIDGYRIAEVYKTGEKKIKTYRGPKPQGYNVYANGKFQTFLPYTINLK